VQGAPPEVKLERATLESERNKDNIGKHWLKRDDGAIVVFNEGGFPSTVIPNLRAREAGTYKLRVTGYGYQIEEPVVFALITGSFNFRNADTVTRSFTNCPLANQAPSKSRCISMQNHGIWISPQGLNGRMVIHPSKTPRPSILAKVSRFRKFRSKARSPSPGRHAVKNCYSARRHSTAELPPDKPWMKGKPGYKPNFTVDSAAPAADSRADCCQASSLAAFRRPVAAADVEPYLKLFDAEFAESRDFLVAMRTAAIAVLCSPEFLYLKEPAGKLSDFALATRLSYFLTRSAPGAELLAAKLTQPEVLRAQTERLLKSATLDRFVTDFTDGWLNLREIDFTTPDKQLYPEYDGLLLDSMLRETRSFITELITGNLSVANHRSKRLRHAQLPHGTHYGIPASADWTCKRSKLPPDSHRGGILTHASVLKVTANGTNTSPVVRGVWVMDRILGMEPPPPPPGVPGVEPDIRGATTLRELLDKHRSTWKAATAAIASSTRPASRWKATTSSAAGVIASAASTRATRSISRSKAAKCVTASGRRSMPLANSAPVPNSRTMPDFQKLLLAGQDRVARCVIEKLLTFATGRAMGFSDRSEIDRLVDRLQNEESCHARLDSRNRAERGFQEQVNLMRFEFRLERGDAGDAE
jgi:hypothetical protein